MRGSADPASREPPSDWILRWAHLVPAGARVLDLACGAGRHACWFAERGARVTAVDRDPQVLAALHGIAGITPRAADLEGADAVWPIEAGAFDAVIVTNYLYRPRLAAITAVLAPEGVLLYETFMRGNERHGRPSNPAFLLAPGELAWAFPELTTIAFEQGLRADGGAVIQRLAATRRALGACRLAG